MRRQHRENKFKILFFVILTILKQPYYNNIKIEDFFLLYTN